MSRTETAWSDLYREAILETDHTVLPVRIEVARDAMQRRARELWYSGTTGVKEIRDLDNGIYFLGLLGKLAAKA